LKLDSRIYTSTGGIFETIAVTSGQVSGGGTSTITINPSSNLAYSTGYYIQIDATAFDDAYGNSFAGISDATTWNFTTQAQPGLNWLSGFTYRKQITIDAANVDSDLSGFPLFVRVNADADLAAATESGSDLRFTTSTGVLIPFERSSWTVASGSGSGNFWVKVPSIDATDDTVIYLYYGSGSAVDGEDATNVWDSSFVGVWHLDETVTDESTVANLHQDSTVNNLDGDQNNNDDTLEK